MPNNSNNNKHNNSDTQFVFAIFLLAGFFIITAAWRAYLDKVPAANRPVLRIPLTGIPAIKRPVTQSPIAETPPAVKQSAEEPEAVVETSAEQVPEMPSPNAYDFYVEAAESFLFINYYNKERNEIRVRSRLKIPASTAGKEALLRKNAKPLAQLKEGLKHSCLVPEPYFYGGPRPAAAKHINPMMAMHFYDLGQLLLAESQVHGSRGNWKEAANRLLDVQKLGHDIVQGGTARNASHSLRCRVASYRELQEIYPRLNAAQAKAVVRRWEEILKQRVTLVDLLRKEKQTTQTRLLRLLEHHSTSRSSSPIEAIGSVAVRYSREYQRNQQIATEHAEYMDSLLVLAEAPFDPKANEPELPVSLQDVRIPSFLIARIHFQQMQWASLQDELHDSLLLTAIALHAYRLEKKAYPRDLKQLVPAYLKQVPHDVFGQREPLRYTASGQKYILYSIGPDGEDDSGRAIEYKPYPERTISDASRYQVSRRSRGDIVMGVNLGRATPWR